LDREDAKDREGAKTVGSIWIATEGEVGDLGAPSWHGRCSGVCSIAHDFASSRDFAPSWSERPSERQTDLRIAGQ
jgi:hypothetical protein